MSECVFCGIAAGKSEASVIYEDDHVIAFASTQYVNPGHTLVVPKKHFTTLGEMDEETGARLFKTAMRIERALRKSGLDCEGTNLFQANGEAAFQEIGHVHLHVFPRVKGDPFKMQTDWSVNPAREELDAHAAKVRAALEGA